MALYAILARMKLPIVSVIILFFTVLGFLMYMASRTGTSIVMQPTEIVEQGQDLKRIRVAGRVVDTGTYETEPKFVLKFKINNPPKDLNQEVAEFKFNEQLSLPVIFEGIRPDMFALNRDVIIDGEYIAGIFYARTLLTQCPSKYEPPNPEGV